ncbi:MAG: leucine-rich repeat domain-containing protein [Bacteroidaceae bacterium]|nr:leucine-rich repeat domain-containing protein [Bacteroidaceae bacterium]
MLTALLLLCSSIASAQIEVDGLYYLADGEGLAVVANPSGTKYSGDIVIPESVTLSSLSYPDFTLEPPTPVATKATKTISFYAEAGSVFSFSLSGSYTAYVQFIFDGNVNNVGVTAGGVNSSYQIDITDTGVHSVSFVLGANTDLAYLRVSKIAVKLDKETEYPITAVGEDAFYNCTGLTSIEIPNSVTSFDNYAFSRCTGLKSVKMPDNLTAIGGGAFRFCTGLTSIEIPNSVTNINYWAFDGCTGLESVYVECTTPPTMGSDNVFSDYTIPLYVPAGSMNAYKAADCWKKFTNMYYQKPDTEVTIEIGEYGCGTYCSPAALDFSEVDGLKAYSAIGFNSSTQVVTLARVMTTAAETGIFLKGEPGTYTVPVIDECSEHTLNLLVGTLETNTINSTSGDMSNFKFTIAEGDSSPMFYPFEDGTSFSVGKAYLQIPTSWVASTAQKSVNIRFDEGETTGIDEVKGENGESKTIYDLSGRKVETPTRGIYIIGGKKVLVK